MIKFFLIINFFIVYLFASNQYSLKGIEKTANIQTNTIDTQKVILDIKKYYQNYNFSTLKKVKHIEQHIKRLNVIESNLKTLSSLKAELELNSVDIKQLQKTFQNAKIQYDRKINGIYKKHKSLQRYSYIVVIAQNNLQQKTLLDNFLLEKYAIKKYDQQTTLKKSLTSTNMKSIIKTQKDFGQKTIDTIYDYVIRANNVKFKILKVTQNPFVKSASNLNTNISNDTDVVNQSKDIKIFDLRETDIDKVISIVKNKYKLNALEIRPFVQYYINNVSKDNFKQKFTSLLCVVSSLAKI